MKKKEAVKQIEAALVTEINNCDEAHDDEWLRGRCYGLAHALAILNERGTDEELWRVAEENKLLAVGARLFSWKLDR